MKNTLDTTDQTRLSTALQRFKALYGDGDAQVWRAPARINIIGEHVDYVSYLPTASLPFASREHDMLMLCRASDDGRIRGASTLERFPPFDFALDDERIEDCAGQTWEAFVFNRPGPVPHWSNYVKGAALFARWKYGASVKRGFDFLIESSIPPSSGASSSSALVVLAGAATRETNQLKFNLDELARDSSQAEWFIGTRGGALDHMAICLATVGGAVFILHGKRQAERVPLPDNRFRWLSFFSHPADKGHEVMLEYNERVAVSRLLIPAFLSNAKDGQAPKTITLDEVEGLYPEVFRECEREFPDLVRERRSHPLKLRDRMRHHEGEAARVDAAVKVLREPHTSDEQKARVLGELMNGSHESLRRFYGVSTPEVERLVKVVNADMRVYGARLMGGGFGGNVLALTTAENTQALIDRVQNEFYSPRGRDGYGEGSVMVSTPGNGLELINSRY
ncbi:MAG TPA: galactokinase family protein [Blastocatellia bacterium]|nr:galactokinase family protein [Blastocatellia bacterium]